MPRLSSEGDKANLNDGQPHKWGRTGDSLGERVIVRRYVHVSGARFNPMEPRPRADDLIRSSLRQAFPLPSADDVDERFRVLLDALAVAGGSNGNED